MAVVAADPGHCHEVLSACERLVAGHPEVEVLSTAVRVWDDEDH